MARRAMEDPPPEARKPRSQPPAKPENFAPAVGRPEVQLVVSFLATAGIVFTFTVGLPILLSWVRNF